MRSTLSRCAKVASGPISAPAASGKFTRSDRARTTSLRTTSLCTGRCTNRREPATHDWPLPSKMPSATAATAASISASAKTMCGDLPPNSSATGMSLRAATSAMHRPLSVPPVKDTMRTSGCPTSATPASWPVPGSTFSSPGGRPASSAMRATASPVDGVTSDGLSTTALPAASAGAIDRQRRCFSRLFCTAARCRPLLNQTGTLAAAPKRAAAGCGRSIIVNSP